MKEQWDKNAEARLMGHCRIIIEKTCGWLAMERENTSISPRN